MSYLVFKWLHIVSIISWMAGILYLYRLLVYHFDNIGNKERTSLLANMEQRLFKIITLPAAVSSIVFGFGLLGMQPQMMHTKWFALKFLFILGLTHFTFYARKLMRNLANENDLNKLSSRKLRIFNEIPALLMIAIVYLVVVKPF